MNTALIIIGIAFVIWRIEKIKDDIRDDIAAIERIRHLEDSAGVVIKD